MTLQELNTLPQSQLKEELFKCCGSTVWAEKLAEKSPFESFDALKHESNRLWFGADEKDWLEAFTHHPKIGDVESLEKKFASTANWASGEQSGVNVAHKEVLVELKNLNDEYEKKFGYIFIVCATGKSAAEMLELLKQRIENDPEEEIEVAVNEQNKITHIRLEKLLA